MTYVPAPNTLQAELRYTYGSQNAENVLHFQGSAGVTPTLATTLGNNLINWWNTNIKPQVVNLLSLREVYITDLSTQTGFTVSVVTGLPSAGSDTTEGIPSNCAFCVSFRTAGRGRSARGRNYVPGLSEADSANSTINSAFYTPVLAGYTILIGAGTFTPGLQFVIVSRFFNKQPRASALIQPVTAVLATSATIASQRRRLPGRGR